MAKVKAPLFSFSASGKLADSLVYGSWKGLDVVRQYIIPANPNTSGQVTQRGYLTDAVAMVQAARVDATHPLDAIDVAAYNRLAGTFGTPRTWFNAFTRIFVNQRVASLKAAIWRDGTVTPGAGTIDFEVWYTKEGANDVTAANVVYGLTPTALINTQAVVQAAGHYNFQIAGLTPNIVVYFQLRPTAHVDFVGADSGIYTGKPT